MFSPIQSVILVYCSLMSLTSGGRLIKRPNGWFITGRGCGASTQITYAGEIPDDPSSMECVFIASEPTEHVVHKLTGNTEVSYARTSYGDQSFPEKTCLHYDKVARSYSSAVALCEELKGRVYEPRDEYQTTKLEDYVISEGNIGGRFLCF